MKKLLLASVLAIASFPGYAPAAEGIEEGVPCHDFSGAAYDRCAKSVTHCQRESGYREPFQDEKAKAHYYACIAKQPDPEPPQSTYEDCRDNAKDFGRCLKQLSLAEQCRQYLQDGEVAETPEQKADYDRCIKEPRARVTVAPPYQGPPPIGWVWGPYVRCTAAVPVSPGCFMWEVNVQADGLNVRVTPNGPPVMSLVNGTPVIPIQKQGDWLLVAPACDLTPTWAWSWNAGVPLNRCWVYF